MQFRLLVDEIRKDADFNPVKVIRHAIETANTEILTRAQERGRPAEEWGLPWWWQRLWDIMHMWQMWETVVCIVIQGQIHQVTKDHSLVQEMVRMGEIKPEEARNHPDKNIITRALGAERTVDIDFFDLKLEPDSTILMCSDGLSNMVEDS